MTPHPHTARTTWIGGKYPGEIRIKSKAHENPRAITAVNQFFLTRKNDVVQSLKAVKTDCKEWLCLMNGVEKRIFQARGKNSIVKRIDEDSAAEIIANYLFVGGQIVTELNGIQVCEMTYRADYVMSPKSPIQPADAPCGIKNPGKRVQSLWYSKLIEMVLNSNGQYCLSADSPKSIVFFNNAIDKYCRQKKIKAHTQQISRCRDGKCRIWIYRG